MNLLLEIATITNYKMPGRQSTGPPVIKDPKAKKRKQKRSLNALAIAEQQHPTKARLRQNRLGASEPDTSKRKRALEDESLDQEDDGRRAKRSRNGGKDRFGNEVEAGSDSEGNEWMLGAVDEDDDSDLDSDEAMGESDEEKFEGFTFRGSSSKGHKIGSKSSNARVGANAGEDEGINLDEQEDDQDESGENDDLGDDAIDLGDAMDDDSPFDDQTSETESEEGSDQHIFSDKSDQEDDADPKKLALLGDLVSNMTDPNAISSKMKLANNAQETMTPSEFGITSRQKLTLADLQSSVTDPTLKKSLKLLAEDTKPSGKRGGIPRKLEVPLARRQQDRLDRAAAYEKSKETLNRWIDTVKRNRRAEHLSFPLKDPSDLAAHGSKRLLPTVNSKPLNDLEAEISKILQESGVGSSTRNDQEESNEALNDLPTINMSVEEVEAKRADLRRARDLLFREEKRAKRIKKIKSKSYRKVHRKEREKIARTEKDALVAAGVEDSESEQERNDRRRAEERMGQRHRESRWAKGVKDTRRAAWDEDTRSGVTEMARRGEELRKRIEGKSVDNDVSDTSDSHSSDDEDEDIDDPDEKITSKTMNRLRKVDEGSKDGTHDLRSGLSAMPFMRKAESMRQDQNREMIEKIRRDLQGEETPSEEEPVEGAARRSYGPQQQNPKINPLRNQQKFEFEEKFPSDNDDEIRFDDDGEEQEIIVNGPNTASKSNPTTSSISRNHLRSQSAADSKATSTIDDNPWLSTKPNHRQKRNRITDDRAEAIISNLLPTETLPPVPPPQPQKPRSALKGARAAATATTNPQNSAPNTAPPPSSNPLLSKPSRASNTDESDSENDLPLLPSNDALIQRAFAGDAVFANFTTEKATATASEAPQTTSTAIPGWGSWTGLGLSKREQNQARHLASHPRNTYRDPGVIEPSKRKDAKSGMERVIINERRVKKNAKYLAGQLPHPYETKAQYERALRIPVGPEWTTKETYQSATKPRVLLKQGVVAPMERPIV